MCVCVRQRQWLSVCQCDYQSDVTGVRLGVSSPSPPSVSSLLFVQLAMGDISDLDRQIDQLRRCELIKENEVKALCAKAR